MHCTDVHKEPKAIRLFSNQILPECPGINVAPRKNMCGCKKLHLQAIQQKTRDWQQLALHYIQTK